MKLSRFIPFALLVALSSCKKNDDKPVVSKPEYLPATFSLTAADTSSLKYGFIYNKDNSVAVLTVTGFLSEGTDSIHLLRNANGECVKVTFSNDRDLTGGGYDSIGYRGNGLTVFIMDGDGKIMDSTAYSFNSQGDVQFFGSKDTMRTASGKSVNYSELTIVNGNPQTITSYNYYLGSGSDQAEIYNSTINYTYDNKANAFQPLFRAEPVLIYFMQNVLSYVSMGKNNLTGVTVSELKFDFTNTYDELTGYLSTQKTTIQGTSLILAYTYIQAK
jgi:hypothetical protein